MCRRGGLCCWRFGGLDWIGGLEFGVWGLGVRGSVGRVRGLRVRGE